MKALPLLLSPFSSLLSSLLSFLPPFLSPLLFLLLLRLLPFPFPFYAANVYTLNNFLLVVNKPSSVLLALRLRLLLPPSLLFTSPSSTLERLISHVVAVVLRFPFRYAYTAVFDLCVCGSLCAGKTCSHAVHLNFLSPSSLLLPRSPAACLCCLLLLQLVCCLRLLLGPHALLLFQSIDAF